jgi:hypothetical protein
MSYTKVSLQTPYITGFKFHNTIIIKYFLRPLLPILVSRYIHSRVITPSRKWCRTGYFAKPPLFYFTWGLVWHKEVSRVLLSIIPRGFGEDTPFTQSSSPPQPPSPSANFSCLAHVDLIWSRFNIIWMKLILCILYVRLSVCQRSSLKGKASLYVRRPAKKKIVRAWVSFSCICVPARAFGVSILGCVRLVSSSGM